MSSAGVLFDDPDRPARDSILAVYSDGNMPAKGRIAEHGKEGFQGANGL